MSLPLGYFSYQKIEQAAKELRKTKGNTDLTPEQAVCKVFETRPDLRGEYEREVRDYGDSEAGTVRKTGSSLADVTFSKIEREAEALRKKPGNTDLTREGAIAKVCESRPDLVNRYRRELQS